MCFSLAFLKNKFLEKGFIYTYREGKTTLSEMRKKIEDIGNRTAPIVIICVAYFGWEKLKSIFSKCGKKEEHEATN